MPKSLGIIIEDDKEIGKIFTIALQNNFGSNGTWMVLRLLHGLFKWCLPLLSST